MSINNSCEDGSAPLLEAREVSYKYPGGKSALDKVSLAVKRSMRLALVGANGAGKTTLLLHLNGILRPSSGQILLDGQPIGYSRKELARLRQAVALVFQDPEDQLFAGTVYQDISFGPLNLGLPENEVRQRVEEALEWLDIADLRNQPVHMLSFGQKKRAAIAGAVAMKPRLLALDEPTGGLDPATSSRLLELLNLLHQSGTTLVVATHDIDFAYEWADEVAVMRQGQVVAQGPSAGVLSDGSLMKSCGLRRPWLIEISDVLGEVGSPSEQATYPKSFDELRTRLLRHSATSPT